MAASLCGGVVSSRRGLLASLWSLVTVLTAAAFLLALIFTLSANSGNDNDDGYYYNNDGEDNNKDEEEEGDAVMAVTSRAMAFSALWTAVLAILMGIFGTVILGWQSPTGQYYTCCSTSVHRTTPLALGSFIGALLMFANLTLVCSVLFGEFEIRDYQREGEDNGGGNDSSRDTAVGRSSMAFSILCMFLTILYAGFAALSFVFSTAVLEELAIDEQAEAMTGSQRKATNHFVGGYDGYIGERFDVRRNGASTFAAPQISDGTLT